MTCTRLNPPITAYVTAYGGGNASEFAANSATYKDFVISGFSSIKAVIPYIVSSTVNGGAIGMLSVAVKEATTSRVRCIVYNAGSSPVTVDVVIVVIGLP